uniref:Uncharacterized protein n=1 Tax=Lutzomyia longipalpis TaxID=7200 RepID=A0A7G3B722_LUTLO
MFYIFFFKTFLHTFFNCLKCFLLLIFCLLLLLSHFIFINRSFVCIYFLFFRYEIPFNFFLYNGLRSFDFLLCVSIGQFGVEKLFFFLSFSLEETFSFQLKLKENSDFFSLDDSFVRKSK